MNALEQIAQSEAQWPAGRFQNDLAYFKAVSLARLGYYAQAKALLLPMQAEKVVDFAYLDAAMYCNIWGQTS